MLSRVLLVDDEPAVTRAVGRLLAVEGFKVFEVNDASSALAAARAFSPHAIILDYGMPYMTGADVAWQLAGDPILQRVPVIICSALAGEIPKSNLPPAHIPIVPKPLDADFILGWLREVVSASP